MWKYWDIGPVGGSFRNLKKSQPIIAAADLMVIASTCCDLWRGQPYRPVVPPDPTCLACRTPVPGAPANFDWAFCAVNPQGELVPAPQVGYVHLPLRCDAHTGREFVAKHGGRTVYAPQAAKVYGVNADSVRIALGIYQVAPDLIFPLRNAELTVNDAKKIQHESWEVRWKAVQAVRRGEARTAVRAVRLLYGREPVGAPADPAESRPPTSGFPANVQSALWLTPSQRAMAAADLLCIFDYHPTGPDGIVCQRPDPGITLDDLPLLVDGIDAASWLANVRGCVVPLAQLAKAYGVSREYIRVGERTHWFAPELSPLIRQGVLSLKDAQGISHEPSELRRQAVQDMRDGKAKTAARAFELRHGHKPYCPPPRRRHRRRPTKYRPLFYMGHGVWVSGRVPIERCSPDIIKATLRPEHAAEVLRRKEMQEGKGPYDHSFNHTLIRKPPPEGPKKRRPRAKKKGPYGYLG